MLWDYEFVSFAVDVYDFDFWVVFYDFAEFCDVNVHATSVVGCAFDPDCFECVVAFEDVVCVLYEQSEEVAFFCCEFYDAIVSG